MHFNAAELAIILVIVVVLFGGGRIGKLGGELGTALREFKRGLNGENNDSTTVPPVVKAEIAADSLEPVVKSMPEKVEETVTRL